MALTAGFGMLLGRAALLPCAAALVIFFGALTAGFGLLGLAPAFAARTTVTTATTALVSALLAGCHFLFLSKK
jgi:hypothetical protein